MNDNVIWDNEHKFVETRICRVYIESGKVKQEEDCTKCKYWRTGKTQMCSDGCIRRFSNCMAKGEPYTILFDYGRCELFTDKELKGEKLEGSE